MITLTSFYSRCITDFIRSKMAHWIIVAPKVPHRSALIFRRHAPSPHTKCCSKFQHTFPGNAPTDPDPQYARLTLLSANTIRPTKRVPHTNRRKSGAIQPSRSPSVLCMTLTCPRRPRNPALSSQDPSLLHAHGALIPRADPAYWICIIRGPVSLIHQLGPGWPFRGVARVIACTHARPTGR